MTQTGAWMCEEHPGETQGPETVLTLVQEQKAGQGGRNDPQELPSECSAVSLPCTSHVPRNPNKAVDTSARPPNPQEEVEEELTDGGTQGSQTPKRVTLSTWAT